MSNIDYEDNSNQSNDAKQENIWDEWIDEDTHKNFCMVPNAVTDLLKVELLGFYVHIKRITGENGKCYQSSRTLAKNCKISQSSVIRYKQELADLGLIHIIRRKKGSQYYDEIHIRDVWGKELTANQNRSANQNKNATRTKIEAKEDLVNNKEYLKDGQQIIPAEPTLHPALKSYRHIARLNIPTSWRDKVIETVGSDPKQLQLWEKIITDWIGHGWNKRNIKSMLECFQKGGIQNKKNGNSKQSSEVYPPGVAGNDSLETAWDNMRYNAHHPDSLVYLSSLEKLQKAGITFDPNPK